MDVDMDNSDDVANSPAAEVSNLPMSGLAIMIILRPPMLSQGSPTTWRPLRAHSIQNLYRLDPAVG